MIVLDTSALLFWTLDPAHLSAKAAEAIDQADRIVTSSIAVWEIALKVKRGKLVLPLSIEEYVARLQAIDKFEILPIDVPAWLENLDLDWDHRDPADRMMVALARRFQCPLVTSDRVMGEYYLLTIW